MSTCLGYLVEAIHDYPHGQGSQAPFSLSEELAVLAIGSSIPPTVWV